MVLEQTNHADLAIHRGEVFELGLDLGYLSGHVTLTLNKTETVKLSPEFFCGAQNIFSMWRGDARDGSGDQRQLQVALAQRLEISGQILGSALGQNFTGGPHGAVNTIQARLSGHRSGLVKVQFKGLISFAKDGNGRNKPFGGEAGNDSGTADGRSGGSRGLDNKTTA